MTAAELAAVICALVAVVATAALSVVCARLVRVTGDLVDAVARFDDVAGPAAERLEAAADGASRQVDRLDDLIHHAGNVSETADAATQAALRVLSNPVIKGAAVATGTGRAVRRLRGRPTSRGA